MANEEAVQPPIATDQSLISGLIQGGGVSRNQKSLFLPEAFPSFQLGVWLL